MGDCVCGIAGGVVSEICGGFSHACSDFGGQAVKDPSCGGVLIILLAIGFLVYAFMKSFNERASQEIREMQQRKYNELQAMKRQLEAKFNLYDISSIRLKADEGDADSQFRLGVAYMTGVNVGFDEAEGMYWLKKAASQGHKDADKTIYEFQQLKAKAQRDQQDFDRWFYLYQADEMARKRDEDFIRKMKRGY